MFDEDRGGDGGASGGGGGAGRRETTHVGRECQAWQEIDARMRRLAARRAALDVEEARMLMLAKRAEIHRHLGYGSFAEYVERVLGYAPNTGRDRVRVAEEMEQLPAIAEAWERGALSYSVVREITRIATPENEEELVVFVDGLTVREVEQAMRGRKKGDDPNARPDPDLEPRVVRMELPPATYALFRDARRHVERATGHMVSDAAFMSVACRAVMGGCASNMREETTDDDAVDDHAVDDHAVDDDAVEDEVVDDGALDDDAEGAAAAETGAEVVGAADDHGATSVRPTVERATGRATRRGVHNVPPHQIAIVVCRDCKRGWQDTPGRSVELPPSTITRMRCDAVELGCVDGDGGSLRPATRTIPAATRRAVLARDHHRCQVPGCSMSRWVDVHHIRHWE
ncbi:MAG TPA: HNH endonuclease signature motif containing protein, partial [Kofleriaceae bacterium]|nr:HNH endonuclease signature motif containing protein [Kofleriaceae bacterium]